MAFLGRQQQFQDATSVTDGGDAQDPRDPYFNDLHFLLYITELHYCVIFSYNKPRLRDPKRLG